MDTNYKEVINRVTGNFKEINNIEKYFNDNPEEYRLSIYSSIMILIGELLEEDKNSEWANIGHEYLCLGKEFLEEYGFYGTSIYGGLCEYAFAVYLLSCNKERYGSFLEYLNEIIVNEVEGELKNLKSNIENITEVNYDVINGVSGVLGYLLNFKENSKVRDLCEDIIKYLINLTEEYEFRGIMVPKFFVKGVNAQMMIGDDTIRDSGYVNLSLSHGISGILMALSLALEEGIEVEGQREAIKYILNFIDKFKVEQNEEIWWINIVTFDMIKGNKKSCSKNFDGWCYGTPGIARGIYKAATLVGDNKHKDIAYKALSAVALNDPNEWGIISTTICHGYSGILAIMTTMYNETKEDVFKVGMNKALEFILKEYKKDYIFGFLDYDKKNSEENKYELVYKKDLSTLSGAIGVLLTLNYLGNEKCSKWLRKILIN